MAVGRILLGLTHASAGYDSVRGRIESRWEISDGEFKLRVTIPPNTKAKVHVPAPNDTEVSEAGKPAEAAEGVELLRVGEDEAILSVGSGRYEFISRWSG